MMTIYNPLFLGVSLLIGILTAYVIDRSGGKEELGRFSTLDSFRGLLAFFVFVHHSVIWYHFLQTDIWKLPDSLLYAHLGVSSVRFFFMITSFLFIGKIINSREIDWKKILKSRIFRIIPLYYGVVFMVVIIALIKTNFTIQESLFILTKQVLHWLGFLVKSNVNINGYEDTFQIVAGVVWTLRWEWLFYFTLPLWHLVLVRKNIKFPVIIFSMLISGLLFHWVGRVHYLHFLGGIIAVYALKMAHKIKVDSWQMSVVVVLSLIGLVMTNNLILNLCLGTIIFCLIVMGNTIFGLLKIQALKWLGDISYSLYLLHGIVLFVVIDMILGRNFVKTFSPFEFWLLIFGLIPVIIIISKISYEYIEKPLIEYGRKSGKK